MSNPAIEQTETRLLASAAAQLATSYVEQTAESARKQRGQFFTPELVAGFMASMFRNIPTQVRVLDSGAGLGILSAAVCDRLMVLDQPREIDAVLFETDPTAVEHLSSLIDRCGHALELAGHRFTAEICVEDFVSNWESSDQTLFGESVCEPFDLAIMNPPYFKIRANSNHANIAKRLGPSQPNIYSLFMALAIDRLRPGGELVAITPRSFCNGLYFRGFRKWLLQRADLLRIHAFGSRKEAFRESKVLQENVITHFRKKEKSVSCPETVTVTRSWGRDFDSIDHDVLPIDRVIDDTCGDSVICIPEQSEDVEILRVAEAWPTRFTDAGLRISTGPIVMFRTRTFHCDQEGEGTVPLLTSHHIANGKVVWPRAKKKWPSCFVDSDASRKHLLPCQNYVLIKRFTSKEEKRRLSAGVFSATEFEKTHIAIENHVNYITHVDRELTLEEAAGIASVLNSSLMDRYFRSFSGNTQVNATEVRTMKFPDLSLLSAIGSRLLNDGGADPLAVVSNVLGIQESVTSYLERFAG